MQTVCINKTNTDTEQQNEFTVDGDTAMMWSDYMVMAAQHSRYNAQHWFRYLRKYIDKCGTLFSKQDVADLCNNEALTPFQRVSLRAAFEEDSETRRHIIGLNQKVIPTKISQVRKKYGINPHE